MAKFRKKPVVIEAVQLTWGTWNEVCDFVPKPWFVRGCYIDAAGNETAGGDGRMGLVMTTLESKHHIAKEGDWIIKGVKGEFYSCDAEVFAATYNPVES